MLYFSRISRPNAREVYPESYFRLWDHANRAGGLYHVRRYGGIPPRAEPDIRDNGATFMTQGGIRIATCVILYVVAKRN